MDVKIQRVLVENPRTPLSPREDFALSVSSTDSESPEEIAKAYLDTRKQIIEGLKEGS